MIRGAIAAASRETVNLLLGESSSSFNRSTIRFAPSRVSMAFLGFIARTGHRFLELVNIMTLCPPFVACALSS